MTKKGPAISTLFFLIAIEFLVCSLVVSALVWISNGMHTSWPTSWIPFFIFIAFLILLGISINSYFSVISTRQIIFPKYIAWFLPVFWLSVIIFYILPVDLFIRQFSQLLPWAMVFLSLLLMVFYFLIEIFSLKYSTK